MTLSIYLFVSFFLSINCFLSHSFCHRFGFCFLHCCACPSASLSFYTIMYYSLCPYLSLSVYHFSFYASVNCFVIVALSLSLSMFLFVSLYVLLFVFPPSSTIATVSVPLNGSVYHCYCLSLAYPIFLSCLSVGVTLHRQYVCLSNTNNVLLKGLPDLKSVSAFICQSICPYPSLPLPTCLYMYVQKLMCAYLCFCLILIAQQPTPSHCVAWRKERAQGHKIHLIGIANRIHREDTQSCDL